MNFRKTTEDEGGSQYRRLLFIFPIKDCLVLKLNNLNLGVVIQNIKLKLLFNQKI